MKVINISGMIILDDYEEVCEWFGINATCPRKVKAALSEANGDEVEVEINSHGGHVFAGFEIFNHLKTYPGNVTVKIYSIAASAASVIAMAGDRILMSPASQLMIHCTSGWASGNHQVMEAETLALRSIDQSMISVYKLKTGRSESEIQALMDHETWMSAETAKNLGFIDEILFSDEFKNSAVAGSASMQITLNRLLDVFQNNKKNELAIEAEKINILKIKELRS